MRHPSLVAKALYMISTHKFGGKLKGRYQLNMADLLRIIGAHRMRDRYFDDLVDELASVDMVAVNFGTFVYVAPAKPMRGCRKAPVAVVEKYIDDGEGEY